MVGHRAQRGDLKENKVIIHQEVLRVTGTQEEDDLNPRNQLALGNASCVHTDIPPICEGERCG